ncbi:MAG: hypothetical protein R3C25_09900 [Hyphomonadaceae bacterium]
MAGLIASELILFAAAALIGFAGGWWLYITLAAPRLAADRHDIEQLRSALTEAQVRRARLS